MKSSVFYFLIVFLLNFNLPRSDGADCSTGAIANRLSKCVQIDFTSPSVSQAEYESLLSQVCRSLESTICCYEDALRDCLSTGTFRLKDWEVFRVTNRYACANIQTMMSAVFDCGQQLTSWKCFDDFLQIVKNLSSSDTDAFVTGYCSAARDFVACSPDNAISSDGSCTSEDATVLQNIFTVSFSVAACEIPHDHPLFTTYGGPSTCGTQSTELQYSVIFISFLFVLFL